MNKFLATLPSTNFRIFVTMFLVALVVVRYVAQGLAIGAYHVDTFSPEWDVLLFLAALAGIDLAQFHLKRKTYEPAPPAKPDVEDAKAGATVPDAPLPIDSAAPARTEPDD